MDENTNGDPKETAVELEVEWPTAYPARAANVFRTARIFDHVEVATGYVPVATVVDIVSGKRASEPIAVQDVRASVMSARSFHEFFLKVKVIYDALVDAGIIEEEEDGGEEEAI